MVKRMWVVARAAAFAMLLIPSIACGCRVLAPKDVSLLTGEPCEPPCWQGLVPGLSTEDEIERFLMSSSLVNRSSIYRGRLSRGGETVGVSIQWLSTANVQGAPARNSFDVEDGTLQDMTIYMDAQVTLEELLDRYGPPAKFNAVLAGIHLTQVRVALLYPERGFIAFVEVPRAETTLRADSTVTWLWYFRAASLDRFLELAREIGFYGGGVDVQSFRDWEGYGPIPMD
jgi:hypothetical protein